MSWAYPYTSLLNGNKSTFDSALHATYTLDDSRKLGLFTGYSSRSTTLSQGGNSVTLGFGEQALGTEALMMVSPQTSVQIRGAILAPMYISASATSGSSTVSTSSFGPDFSNLGGVVGASASQQFSSNWSGRLDASYASFTVKSANIPVSELNAALTAQYTFDSMPLTYGLSAGYNHETVSGTGTDYFTLSNRLTYSFGGPAQGAKGHLFRSGVLGWTD